MRDADAATRAQAAPPPVTGLDAPFDPGDREAATRTPYTSLPQRRRSTRSIYGYPSGVIGLRLMLNPDFFGNTHDAAEARRYWDETGYPEPATRYYDLEQDDACGSEAGAAISRKHVVCLLPRRAAPAEAAGESAEPAWDEPSSTIGKQYWTAREHIREHQDESGFMYHFLKKPTARHG